MTTLRRIVVEKYTTAIRIYCDTDGRISDAKDVSIHPFLKSRLIEYDYDPRRKIRVVKYCFFRYENNTGILHLPVCILDHLINYLNQNLIETDVVDCKHNESKTIDIVDNGEFTVRDYQEDAIKFLTSDEPMKALELQTGSGKTFVAIVSIIALKKRTLVVLPASLVNQWADSFENLSTAKIGVIRGSKSIYDLISNDYLTDVDIYLASVSTLQEYVNNNPQYQGLPSFRDFIKGMKFGVKVTDECHLNFHTNVMIDIQSDIEHNIYLSATYMRSGKNSDQIFKRIFPDHIKYDQGGYNRYVNITECNYSFGPIADKYVSTPRGYMQAKYESWLLRSPQKLTKMFEKIAFLVKKYFIDIRKDKQRILILVGTIDFGTSLVAYLREVYPDMDIEEYFSSTDDEILNRSEIIVSTSGSCGTGKDLKGLRSMIAFVSFAAEALTYQTLGRLRAMDDTPEFIYLVNRGINSHIRHSNIRRPIYRHLCRSFNTLEL